MATFETSYHITEMMEGGYSNNAKDKGGETYKGISRQFYPNWKGWQFIYKKVKPISRNTVFPELEQSVKDFYKKNFWEKLRAYKMGQNLANQLFDFAVHSGVSTASKYLQIVCNSQNRHPDVVVIIGNKTLLAVYNLPDSSLAEKLLQSREIFIQKLAVQYPEFKKGWINRIAFLKSHLSTVGISFGAIALIGLTLFF